MGDVLSPGYRLRGYLAIPATVATAVSDRVESTHADIRCFFVGPSATGFLKPSGIEIGSEDPSSASFRIARFAKVGGPPPGRATVVPC